MKIGVINKEFILPDAQGWHQLSSERIRRGLAAPSIEMLCCSLKEPPSQAVLFLLLVAGRVIRAAGFISGAGDDLDNLGILFPLTYLEKDYDLKAIILRSFDDTGQSSVQNKTGSFTLGCVPAVLQPANDDAGRRAIRTVFDHLHASSASYGATLRGLQKQIRGYKKRHFPQSSISK
jgi:hypothetical protein